VDGNTTTRWSSAYSDPQWITVDLGSTVNIGHVKLTWETAYAIAYQIQVSTDNSNWTTIKSVTGGDGGVDDWTGLSGTGRYVRMYGTTRATQWGYSLWEFEVYAGSGSTTPTATATATSTPTPTATSRVTPTATATTGVTPTVALGAVIPKPVTVTASGGTFILPSSASIYVEPSNTETNAVASYLASKLKPATGYALSTLIGSGAPPAGNIYLTTVGADTTLGSEGYELTITGSLVTIKAPQPEGLFRGVQTLRQHFAPAVEKTTAQSGPWALATGTIRDYPRFAYRGAMLDVARHFFQLADVKTYVDEMALYKINRFHIHLGDDQGWRLQINTWPQLTTIGGSTQVGGGAGGYYTQAQYTDLVNYAAARYITVVPEFDMPGHTNAALASYAQLNCSGVAPALYTGTDVGFSSLCVSKAVTYTFLGDVFRELAAITPGQYLHVGGDEASSTTQSDYVSFYDQVKPLLQGKSIMGWEEIGNANIPAGSLAQHWGTSAGGAVVTAVQKGAKAVMSPANRAYLDMKYNTSTSLGQNWAGYIEVQDAYNWDPASQGVAEANVLGVEAPLWTETIVTLSDLQFMAFPRLPGHAELGWSPAAGRTWSEYSVRLGNQGTRMTNMGINFFHSTQVTWK
jgi:hexosaminidase